MCCFRPFFRTCYVLWRWQVWDTELLQHVTGFATPSRVQTLALSSVATGHCLIAAAGDDAHVRLCDITSGAFTHTLTGHRDNIWALNWSLLSEWMLVSGGCDGQVSCAIRATHASRFLLPFLSMQADCVLHAGTYVGHPDVRMHNNV